MASLTERLSPGRLATFQAFTDPSFRLLWAGGCFWYVARMMEMAVLAWLILDLTDSPSQVAYVGFFRMLPMFLLGTLTGSIADRFAKKHVLVAAQAICFAAATSLTAMLYLGAVQPWHGFLAIFLSGIANALDFSARRAYYSEILPPERLVNAISLDMASMTSGSMLGPVLGGVLISWTGFGGAYLAMALMYGACLLLFVPVRRAVARKAQAMASPLAQAAGAVAMIQRNRLLLGVLLVTIALNFAIGPFMSLISVVARDTLHTNSVLYGILASASGVGSLIGSLVIASKGVQRKGTLYTLGAAAFMGGVFLFSVSTVYALSVLVLIGAGFGMSGFGTMQTTIALQAVGPEQRGRALGAIAFGIGASPLGILIAGYLAEVIGTPATLAVMSGLGVAAVLGLYWAFPELRDRQPAKALP
jgi:MFS family permease